MATEVGSLYYDLNIDDKNLGKALDSADKQVKGFGDKIGQHWDKAVGASKAVATGLSIAGAAVVGFGALSLKAFSESQDVMAQTEAVIKSTGGVAGVTADEVSKLASSLQGVTKFSDEAVQSGENLLLTFTGIGKDIFPEATKTMLDMSQALGQDTKASAIQLGKALNDPILGVTALRKVGVSFSEAQQDVIKNLVETGRKAEAQKLILQELKLEFGGSAEAAGKTLSGQLEILKNSFGDVQEVIGATIAKAIQPFLGKLIEMYNRMGGAQGVVDRITAAFQKIRPHLDVIGGALAGMVAPAIIAGLVAIATAAWGIVAPLIPWAIAGAAVVLIVEKIVEKMGGWGAVMDRLRPVLEQLKQWLITAKDWAVAAWDRIKESAQGFYEIVRLLVTGDFRGGIFGMAEDTTLIDWLFRIREQAGQIWQQFMTLVGYIQSALVPAWNILKTVFEILMPPIMALISSLWDRLLPALVNIWEAVVRLWNALNPGLMIAVGVIAAVIGAALVAAVWLAINVLNIIISVLSFLINILATVIGWIANLIGWFGNLIGVVINTVSAIIGWFSRLPGNISNIVNQVVGFFQGLPGRIGSALSGVGNALTAPFSAGFNGIKNLWNNTVGKIKFTVPDWVPGIGGKGWSFPQFANGVQNFSGGWAIVGERGPELVNLPAGSDVIPNGQFGGGGLNIGGDFVVMDRQDADYILGRMDRNFQLERRGGSPL